MARVESLVEAPPAPPQTPDVLAAFGKLTMERNKLAIVIREIQGKSERTGDDDYNKSQKEHDAQVEKVREAAAEYDAVVEKYVPKEKIKVENRLQDIMPAARPDQDSPVANDTRGLIAQAKEAGKKAIEFKRGQFQEAFCAARDLGTGVCVVVRDKEDRESAVFIVPFTDKDRDKRIKEFYTPEEWLKSNWR